MAAYWQRQGWLETRTSQRLCGPVRLRVLRLEPAARPPPCSRSRRRTRRHDSTSSRNAAISLLPCKSLSYWKLTGRRSRWLAKFAAISQRFRLLDCAPKYQLTSWSVDHATAQCTHTRESKSARRYSLRRGPRPATTRELPRLSGHQSISHNFSAASTLKIRTAVRPECLNPHE